MLDFVQALPLLILMETLHIRYYEPHFIEVETYT